MLFEAFVEISSLPKKYITNEYATAVRIDLCQRMGEWEAARVMAEALAIRTPQNWHWWIEWAYAIRRELSVEAARAVLKKAEKIHSQVPKVIYNLACYACVLDELVEARSLLDRAFGLDESLKNFATTDPDLAALLTA